MTLEIGTPALLFPAISLLFLSYTNRFLHIGSLIRHLHKEWADNHEDTTRAQIDNLRTRLSLIRAMQILGATSLILCVASMVCVMTQWNNAAIASFAGALALMGGSLACLLKEIWISGGALRILLQSMENSTTTHSHPPNKP